MTAQYAGNAQCKVYSIVEETENARVLCFAPDGTPTGNVFRALVTPWRLDASVSAVRRAERCAGAARVGVGCDSEAPQKGE